MVMFEGISSPRNKPLFLRSCEQYDGQRIIFPHHMFIEIDFFGNDVMGRELPFLVTYLLKRSWFFNFLEVYFGCAS